MDDPREYFDEVLQILEQAVGWKTARIKRPVLIIGSLDGIEKCIWHLIRSALLNILRVPTPRGPFTLHTLAKVIRIKGALILKINASGDFIALADHLGTKRTAATMLKMDDLYPQPNGKSALRQLTSYEVYVVAGHKGNPDAVQKKPSRPAQKAQRRARTRHA